MSSDDLDPKIAALFAERRRADETSAPDFRELLARPYGRRASSRHRVWRPALAAAAIALVAVALLLLYRARSPRDSATDLPSAAAALAAWKAPTDSLLETPGADLLHQLPTLVSPEDPSLKGVER